MADERCPSCGAELPREAGQHALTPSAGVVECPTCGATVTLAKPGAAEQGESGAGGRAGEAEEYFSGQETVEDVMKEVRDKEAGEP